MKGPLSGRLARLFSQHWPQEAAELGSLENVEKAIADSAGDLDTVLSRLHRRLTWARSTRAELHKKKDTGLIEKEEEQLLRRCDEFINSIVKCERATYTLTVLANEGFLPGYGVYEGGIKASARRTFTRGTGLGPSVIARAMSSLQEFRTEIGKPPAVAFFVSRYQLGRDEAGSVSHASGERRKLRASQCSLYANRRIAIAAC